MKREKDMSQEHILFRSQDDRIFLVDIPTSIAEAQLLKSDCSSRRELLSCSPLLKPFPSTEPKKANSTVTNIKNHTGNDELHKLYAMICRDALEDTRAQNTSSTWCLQRVVLQSRDDAAVGSKRLLQSVTSQPSKRSVKSSGVATAIVAPLDEPATFLNGHRCAVTVTKDIDHEELMFSVPPLSGFLLGRVEDTAAFQRLLSRNASVFSTSRFDIVVLDPPWPNRSVARKSAYETTLNLQDMHSLLFSIPLGHALSADGFVGIWITNKPAVRELVLGAAGLFETWGVRLVEEWIWLKVTACGEPVTAIDGVWRKPYELILIGRKVHAADVDQDVVTGGTTRRVVIGTPDLHSRKPCLKYLFEQTILASKQSHAGLEVFARYMVAGWLAWGDEAIKYNQLKFWTAGEGDTEDVAVEKL